MGGVVELWPVGEVAALRTRRPARLRHGAQGVAALVEDIKVNGVKVPLVVHQRRDGTRWLANGNHRLAAAELLGLELLPVVVEVTR